MSLYGNCDIDMCASARNKKKNYHAMFSFCLTVILQLMDFPCAGTSINHTYFPFSCIGSVLQNIEQDEAEVVVKPPLLLTHPWFLKLLQMVVTQPYLLPIPEKILTLPESNIKHPLSTEKNDIKCFQNLRKEICHRGKSEDAASVIISSWRSSTRKQYETFFPKMVVILQCLTN